MKFLDKEMGTLGERIKTLFRKPGITIVSILTTLGMTLGILIEALLGGPSTTSTPTSGGTTTSDKKGARQAERASNLTFSKCLHLVDLNNPRILMTHDKIAVTANIRAKTVQSFQTSITAGSVVYLY